jgi:hypothetical protein
MPRDSRWTALRLALFVVALLLPALASAGGAWVPEPWKGDVELGFSRKTASSSWDASGNSFVNTTNVNGQPKISYHDFRYGFLSGEVGLFRRVSAHFLVTYLDGLEGAHGREEDNSGLSDAWFGAKVALRQDALPMALKFTLRTPMFYDISGPYNRYLFDAQGNRRALSPEWRGLLKRDYTLSYLISRSFHDGQGWANLETGYTWREGAPADQIPLFLDAGYPLAWHGTKLKGAVTYIYSRGNDSPRQPDDRFGANATFNFNDASYLKAGMSVLVPLGHRGAGLEVGYNQWLWGESARRYREPFLSFSTAF